MPSPHDEVVLDLGFFGAAPTPPPRCSDMFEVAVYRGRQGGWKASVRAAGFYQNCGDHEFFSPHEASTWATQMGVEILAMQAHHDALLKQREKG